MTYIRTTLVKPRHIYSQQDLPWQMETDAASPKERLFNLLGGGMKTNAVSSGAARIARRKQGRFLKFAALFAILWTIFFFV